VYHVTVNERIATDRYFESKREARIHVRTDRAVGRGTSFEHRNSRESQIMDELCYVIVTKNKESTLFKFFLEYIFAPPKSNISQQDLVEVKISLHR